MPDKLPNHIFSREKDRQISPAEARIGRILSHWPSTKRKSGTYAVGQTSSFDHNSKIEMSEPPVLDT
jgi:hypothetical protein